MENAELLYFSIQHPNGETTETTDRADALRVYEDWCSKYPGTNVELVETWGKTALSSHHSQQPITENDNEPIFKI
jgi:hypothetical protein